MVRKDSDPTSDPGFKRTLRNLLTAPPKRQADMKVGKKTKRNPKRAAKDSARRDRSVD